MGEKQKMNQKKEILTLEHIGVMYERAKPVLEDVSLSIYEGEILGIRGENGAGKSTLMGVAAGIIRPYTGTRRLEPGLEKRITLVPQDPALYPALTGRQNLEFWAEIYGVRGREKDERIRSLLARTHLEEKADKRVETYSGGMKRRLNLAAALVITPGLLLLDEPSVGMDAESVQEMYTWLRELREEGTSVILISHETGEAEEICDRIMKVSHGRVQGVEERFGQKEDRRE